ncbi:hypothetical protein HYS31_07025 [Candidatus Woesearchaeota archaeon]|nr:hypothetical protein [Candidatus Woesearchaeota archaeon]
MKKDVNKVLLFLLVVPLVLYAILSAYYESRLKDIEMKYMENAAGNVVFSRINETIKSNAALKSDKESLERGYYELKSSNEELNNKNQKLLSEANSLKSEIESLKDKFDTLLERFQQVQNALISANDKNAKLSGKVSELCAKLKEAGGKDEKC